MFDGKGPGFFPACMSAARVCYMGTIVICMPFFFPYRCQKALRVISTVPQRSNSKGEGEMYKRQEVGVPPQSESFSDMKSMILGGYLRQKELNKRRLLVPKRPHCAEEWLRNSVLDEKKGRM